MIVDRNREVRISLAEQIADLQRQLEEVTRERDQYKRACELNDALTKAGRLSVVVPE